MKKVVVILFVLGTLLGHAQELNCAVQVNSSQLSGDKRIYETLQKAIVEFMNNRRWTNDTYKNDERIACSILITVSDHTNDAFKATIQVQSSRPTYKSSYNSPLINYNDQDFQFSYVEFQPLDFAENAYLSNLTSVLAFYADMFIALDYDSYSLFGGTQYYQKAATIGNNAQNDQSVKGWNSFDGTRNRYWMVNNMLDPVYAPIREFLYKFHRQGLDVMSQNKEQGRAVIVDAMSLLQKTSRDRPSSFSLTLFFNAKADELVNVFGGATGDEKVKVLAILNEIDPVNSQKYQKIMTTNNNTN
jgi:hypothetical protein